MFNYPIILALITFSLNLYAAELETSPPFQANTLKPSQMDFGGIGLMQMPTGRMADEGEFSFSLTQNSEYEFYSFSLQLMPWLESTIRYTEVQDLLYSDEESFSGDTKLADKGIDVKVQFLNESHWMPEVSFGIRDIGGTGLFDGEFIAATKSLATDHYGQFDFTLGLGWGYLGQSANISNPACEYSSSFCTRDSSFNENGGTIDIQRWFRGNTALYGGIEYQTLFAPLRLKLEYDGNDYSQDVPVTRGNVSMTQDSPWNFGLVYGMSNFSDLRLSYERGNTLTLGISLFTNFNDNKQLFKNKSLNNNDTTATPINKQKIASTIDWESIDNALSSFSGYNKNEFYLDDSTLTIVSEQKKYRDRDIAQDKAASTLSNNLPNNIQQFKIVEKVKSIPVKTTIISRDDYINYASVNYINPKIEDATTESKTSHYAETESTYKNLKDFYYGFSPSLTQTLGSAENFYLYSIGAKLNSSYWLSPRWQLESSLYFNMLDNYDKFNYTVPDDGTSNPRVRTLAREYIHDNPIYITNLQLSNFQKLGNNWYQQSYFGYLEQMFAGVGSEVLYRKKNSNWALGLDWNLVSQREPDSWLGTFNNPWEYSNTEEVLSQGTTGHASIYYRPEWTFLQNTLFRLDYGKFLAQDIGAQLDFSKQFKSGIIAGVYASKTDMSAEEFGEGSFTKGFYFTVPFDILTIKPSTSRANFHWQPLTRDGGQKLNKQNNLYDMTDQLNPWYESPVRE